jgi:SnoaL-like domain
MKLHVLLALAALVVGFTVPALAQQKEPPLSEQDYQKLLAMGKKNDEAWSKSDAAALVALYTDDAVFVTPSGILSGKEAIEKRYQDVFKDLAQLPHFQNFFGAFWGGNRPRSRYFTRSICQKCQL